MEFLVEVQTEKKPKKYHKKPKNTEKNPKKNRKKPKKTEKNRTLPQISNLGLVFFSVFFSVFSVFWVATPPTFHAIQTNNTTVSYVANTSHYSTYNFTNLWLSTDYLYIMSDTISRHNFTISISPMNSDSYTHQISESDTLH